MLNNELSQKLAHGEVGLSLLGFVIPISQSGQRSSPAIHTPPQAIHNLSTTCQSPPAPPSWKNAATTDREMFISLGGYTRVMVADSWPRAAATMCGLAPAATATVA